MVLDGGAYASTSSAVLINAVTHAQGPYRCPNAVVDGYAVRTNHLPCGAMRGFGVVQACFAHESQMDRLADACGLDPVEIRLRNAMRTGDRLITGQAIDQRRPRRACIRETAALPLPDPGRQADRAADNDGSTDVMSTDVMSTDVMSTDVMRLPVAPVDRRTRRHRSRHRLGRRDQEPHVLRGVRRLLDGTLPPR